MIDVVATVVGCASAGALVWFLERVVFYERPRLSRAAYEEKKRVLERDRAEWFSSRSPRPSQLPHTSNGRY